MVAAAVGIYDQCGNVNITALISSSLEYALQLDINSMYYIDPVLLDEYRTLYAEDRRIKFQLQGYDLQGEKVGFIGYGGVSYVFRFDRNSRKFSVKQLDS